MLAYIHADIYHTLAFLHAYMHTDADEELAGVPNLKLSSCGDRPSAGFQGRHYMRTCCSVDIAKLQSCHV